jgi:hypothetical protein
MKVTIQQSGGYLGYLRKTVDTSQLDPAEEARFRSLVEQSNLLAMQGEQRSKAGNMPTYEITIEMDGRVHQITFDDATKPESAAPLLKYIQQRGQPLPPP